MNGWEWRTALNGGLFNHEFHAYDGDDGQACSPSWHLIQSIRLPDEGSDLCPECMAIVRTTPADPRAIMRGVPMDAACASRVSHP